MEPIYVTGHRNPDTDSIVSAMAYAALRNALGDREFVPARLGHISDETRLVLGRFGFEPPIRIQTMRTQVRDLDYDTPPALSGAVTVSRASPPIEQLTLPEVLMTGVAGRTSREQVTVLVTAEPSLLPIVRVKLYLPGTVGVPTSATSPRDVSTLSSHPVGSGVLSSTVSPEASFAIT